MRVLLEGLLDLIQRRGLVVTVILSPLERDRRHQIEQPRSWSLDELPAEPPALPEGDRGKG